MLAASSWLAIESKLLLDSRPSDGIGIVFGMRSYLLTRIVCFKLKIDERAKLCVSFTRYCSGVRNQITSVDELHQFVME